MFMLRKSHLFAFAVVLAMITSGVAFTEDTSKEQVLKPSENAISQEDILKVSEAFGHLIGKNLESLGFEFDMTQVIKGMEDSVAGKESPMNETECVQAISIVQEEAFQKLAKKNRCWQKMRLKC